MGAPLSGRTPSAIILAVLSTFTGNAGLAAESGAAKATEPPEWIPTVSLGLGSFDERLRARIDGTPFDSYRSQGRTFIAVGLAHPVAHLADARLWVDGHAAIGAGLTFETGHWQLPMREDLTLAFAATRWLTLRGGLGLGLTIDVTASRRTFAELGVPVGVTFFKTIELVYRPVLTIPLASETSPVFGGDRELSTRFGVQPFELLLRARLGALGW